MEEDGYADPCGSHVSWSIGGGGHKLTPGDADLSSEKCPPASEAIDFVLTCTTTDIHGIRRRSLADPVLFSTVMI